MAENEDSRSEEKGDSAKGYYEEYKNYANTLRLWFVAYGVGVPYLFVTQPEAWKKLSNTHFQEVVIRMFLIGVLCQVLLACVNKYVNWFNYCDAPTPAAEKRGVYWIADITSTRIWFDILLDSLTLILFALSTAIAFRALVG